MAISGYNIEVSLFAITSSSMVISSRVTGIQLNNTYMGMDSKKPTIMKSVFQNDRNYLYIYKKLDRLQPGLKLIQAMVVIEQSMNGISILNSYL